MTMVSTEDLKNLPDLLDSAYAIGGEDLKNLPDLLDSSLNSNQNGYDIRYSAVSTCIAVTVAVAVLVAVAVAEMRS